MKLEFEKIKIINNNPIMFIHNKYYNDNKQCIFCDKNIPFKKNKTIYINGKFNIIEKKSP